MSRTGRKVRGDTLEATLAAEDGSLLTELPPPNGSGGGGHRSFLQTGLSYGDAAQAKPEPTAVPFGSRQHRLGHYPMFRKTGNEARQQTSNNHASTSLLYVVKPRNLQTFFGGSALLMLVALAAAYLPAR